MTATAARADLERLGKVLGLLGSHHIGERAAAALQADKLVRSKLGGWGTVQALLVGGGTARGSAGRRRQRREGGADPVPPSAAHTETCNLMLLRPENLTDWERRFLISLRGFRALSEAQASTLDGIKRSFCDKEARRHG